MSKKEQRKAPVLRFKGFTDDWEQRKLGDIATFINGRAYSKNELLHQGKYKVLRVGNFYTNDSWYYSDMELDKKYYANYGDLLYTWSATFGPHIWKGEKVIYHYHIWKIILSDEITKNFTLQLLEHDKNRLLAEKNGSTMIHLTKKDMENKEIVIPSSTNEQDKVGLLLTKLDYLITLQQRKLDILKQLKKTYLSEMYCIKKLQNPKLRFLGFSTNWKKYQIKQLGKVITGSTPSTKHSEYYNNKDGIPWVTPTDIHQNITYSSARKISKKGQKIARIVPQNTILVTCIASIGKNTILGQMGSFNQQINGLIPDFKKYDLYFLFTQTEFWSLKMKQLASAGTMQIVNKKEFENIETFIPNLNEQQKIGSLFLQLDNCVSDAQKKITSFKQIKNFFLQNMFI